MSSSVSPMSSVKHRDLYSGAVSSPRVVVVGSLNVDLVYRVEHLPLPGETLIGSGLRRLSGGKGGNQAHAAARLAGPGTRVAMIGGVGTDDAGALLRADLVGAGVDVAGVAAVDGPSGMALIAVDDDGENSIVVIPGANAGWSEVAGEFGAADVVVAQLEIPFGVVARALNRARASGARTVLNAAPLDRAVLGLLDQVSVLVVNEGEARGLFDVEGDLDDATVAGIRDRIPSELVITLGSDGVIVVTDRVTRIPVLPVEAVDTVGAGDAFVGALASSLADGYTLVAAARHGAVAGALTATVHGARHPGLVRGEMESLARSLE